MPILSAEKLAYAAGIFDGEGSVIVRKYKSSGRYTCVVRISVGNTDARITRLLQLWFGGCVTETPRKGNRKDYYQWEVSSLAAERVLRQIHPYLRLKRQRSALALKLRALTIFRGRVNRVPPAIRVERERLAGEIARLNKKGKVA